MKRLTILALAALFAASFQPPPLSAFDSPPPVVRPAPPRPTPPPRHERHERHTALVVVVVAAEPINWLDVDYQVGPGE